MPNKKTTSLTISDETKKKIMDFRKKYAKEFKILGVAESAEYLIGIGIKAHKFAQ